MNEHVTRCLNEYYDGALTGNRRAQVEKHLNACPACRAELAALARISSLLQEVPPAVLSTSQEQFSRQVNLRLPRRTAWKSGQASSLSWRKAWPYLPLSLVVVWAFLQAFGLVVGLLIVGLSWSGVAESYPLAARLVGDSTFDWIWPALELTALYWLGMLVVLGLFLSWLAGWIALCRSQQAATKKIIL